MSLLDDLGFKTSDTGQADLVLRDLRGKNGSMPAPPAYVPTLAIVDDTGMAVRALRSGYAGYLGQGATVEDVNRAARAVLRGEPWAERRVLALALANVDDLGDSSAQGLTSRLTERETQVLQQLLLGLTNIAIAEELGISPKTVKGHISRIYSKLLVRNRKELLIALA